MPMRFPGVMRACGIYSLPKWSEVAVTLRTAIGGHRASPNRIINAVSRAAGIGFGNRVAGLEESGCLGKAPISFAPNHVATNGDTARKNACATRVGRPPVHEGEDTELAARGDSGFRETTVISFTSDALCKCIARFSQRSA